MASLPNGATPMAIASGYYHSLAIGSDGKLYAWGYDAYGELGNGSTNASGIPIVINLPNGATPVAISAGGLTSLAIGSDGKLYAWGNNQHGELGNGSTTLSNTPVVVNLPAGVTPTGIATGGEHSLALGNDGKLYAWGYNGSGQLGNNSTTNSATPVVVSLPTGITATKVAAGESHSLAIGNDGQVYTWGGNDAGQLGIGSRQNSSRPVMVSLPTGVTATAIAGGWQHSLAIGNDNRLYAWGYNGYGQLVNGNTFSNNTPTGASLPPHVTPIAIAAGQYHSLVVAPLNPPTMNITNVSQVEGNSGTTNFVFKATLTYASYQTITVNYATGDGTAAAPSDYTPTSGILTFSPGSTTQTITVPVIGDTNVESNETFRVLLSNPTAAVLGTAQGIGTILNDEPLAAYAWGSNAAGQLGNGSTTDNHYPTLFNLPSGITITAVAAGYQHNLAIGSNNQLYAWGRNNEGEFGNGTTTSSNNPVAISSPFFGLPIIAVAAGYHHSLTIRSDGLLYAWGDNPDGELGNGSTTQSTTPTNVKTPPQTGITAIAAGKLHNLAIGNDGKLYAWGYNGDGELGNGTTTNGLTPIVVSLPNGAIPTAIAAGGSHSLAIGSDGNLYAWGGNAAGQLGNGSTTNSLTPILVSLPVGVAPIAIAAGYQHSLAIGSDGNLYAWGYNADGELGNSTTVQSPTPVVVSLPAGVIPINISAGYQHSLAIGSDGKLYAWGNNSNGQLGDGSTVNSTTPVLAILPFKATPAVISAGYQHSLATGTLPAILNINNVSQLEGDNGITNFVFTITLSYPVTDTVTVNYATSDGTATAPSDYTATSGTLTFSPGITTQTLSVPVNGDFLEETNETFTVTLSSSSGAALTSSQGIGTILNDDIYPVVNINNVTQPEGNTGSTNFTFTAILTTTSNQTVTVDYATSNGTATAPSDYTVTSGTLTFSPGITTQTLTIPVIGDLIGERNETFKVTLSNPSGAKLGIAQGTATILNDDPLPSAIWGYNGYGQLGDGSTTDSNAPIPISLPAGITPIAIAAGEEHTLAIGSDGKVYAWGYNGYGQLGNSSTTDSPTPVTVRLPPGITPISIAAGGSHSLAIGSDGKLYAWGENNVGQLGDGSTTNSSTPVAVQLPPGITPISIAAGGSHSLAIGSDGKLYAWGENNVGQLGDGSINNSVVPIPISLSTGITPISIAAGGSHSLAIGNDGKAYAWGYNYYGQLGNGSTAIRITTPGIMTLPDGVTPIAIAAGLIHSLVIGNNGKLYACGDNAGGKLGNSSFPNSPTLVMTNLPAGIIPVAIAAGESHSLAIGNDGKLYAWGSNYYGQLGNGSNTSSVTPIVVNLPSGATPTSISAGGQYSLSIKTESPTISINNVSKTEGNNGITNFIFTATLAYATNSTVSVEYATSDGTANAPGDYTSTTGTLTFSPGITTQTISVPIIGDTALESDETFTVTLSNPSGATLGTVSQGTGTIINDDSSVSLTSSLNPSLAGQTITLTATVTPITATGTVTFTDGVTVLGTASLISGTAVYTTSNLSAGSHNISATYSGNAAYGSSTSQPITQTVNRNTSALTLVSNPNPANFGQAVTFTATISPLAATGTVTFTDGATVLGTASLISGTTVYTNSNLSVGSHTISVTYDGNNSYAGATSQPVTQVVNPGTTGLNLTSSPNPSKVGQSVTFTSTVNPPSASGVVSFTLDGNTTIPVTLSGGMATYITNTLTAGSHSIASTYSGDASYNSSSSSVITQVVNLNTSSLSLTSSVNPSKVGQSVTFTATVSPAAASGIVSFTVDSGSAIPVTVAGGIATYSTSTLSAGSHNITATYGGDTAYAGSTNSLTQIVGLNSATVSITSSPNPAAVGQTVTFTATVSPTAASGTVTFTEGANIVGTATLISGSAVYTTSSLIVGSHVISATYGGDTSYVGASSQPITQVVNFNSSSLSLTSSTNPSKVGQSVTFTATVSPAAASGIVSFTVDSGAAIPVPVSGGIATYTTSILSAGSHNIVATYGGDTSYAGSTNNLTQLVGLNSTSLSLTSNPNPASVGQVMTFTATLNPVAATGTVTFTEGATILGTASIVSGTAVYTNASLIVGSHVISATYGGDTTYAGASSQPITQVVVAACAPLVVTAVTDDGTGTHCGTLSYALSQPITGSTPVTVTFAIAQGNTITFTGSLTATAKVKAGVTIYGGTFGSTNRVILNGNGVAGDGLHLAGNNYLVNLTIEHFGAKELVLEGPGNRMQGVIVIAS